MALVFVPKESHPDEARVAATPETVRRLVKAGLEVLVEESAGVTARYLDASYVEAGAEVGAAAWARADLVLGVQPPSKEHVAEMKGGALLVAFLQPSANPELVRALSGARVTSFAMDLVPRITRAQPMDALSSQANIAGYKGVLVGVTQLGKMCPLMMTAAGTIPPAKVVIFGAGVAGLQAIATARRLGCKVEATDVRLAAKEQVESLGARFIEVPGAEDLEGEGGYAKEAGEDFLKRQREQVAKRVADADLVVTTAQIPGRKAPVLIDETMVRSMRPGSVIVDLAVDSGGNCALSEAGEIVERHGVILVGTRNLPATVAVHASDLYAKNVNSLVKLMIDEGALEPDLEDEVLAGCLLTHDGKIAHAPTADALEGEKAATE